MSFFFFFSGLYPLSAARTAEADLDVAPDAVRMRATMRPVSPAHLALPICGRVGLSVCVSVRMCGYVATCVSVWLRVGRAVAMDKE